MIKQCKYFRSDCRSNNSVCSNKNASYTSECRSYRCGTILQPKFTTRHTMARCMYSIENWYVACAMKNILFFFFFCLYWRGCFICCIFISFFSNSFPANWIHMCRTMFQMKRMHIHFAVRLSTEIKMKSIWRPFSIRKYSSILFCHR